MNMVGCCESATQLMSEQVKVKNLVLPLLLWSRHRYHTPPTWQEQHREAVRKTWPQAALQEQTIKVEFASEADRQAVSPVGALE